MVRRYIIRPEEWSGAKPKRLIPKLSSHFVAHSVQQQQGNPRGASVTDAEKAHKSFNKLPG